MSDQTLNRPSSGIVPDRSLDKTSYIPTDNLMTTPMEHPIEPLIEQHIEPLIEPPIDPVGLHFIPLPDRRKSLANLFSGRLLLAAGLDWTRAEPGLSLREQARDIHQDGCRNSLHSSSQNGCQNSWQPSLNGSLPRPAQPADPVPDHGLVIEERAGFARLYGSHALSKDGAGNKADTMPARPEGTVCDAFCTVCSLAALRLQSLRHGIEIWPLPDSQDSGSAANPSAASQAAAAQAAASQSGTVWWVFAARLGRLSARADKCFSSPEEALSLARRLQESLDLQEARVLDDTEVKEELNRLARAGSDAISKARLKPLSLLSCQALHNRGLRRGLAALLFGGLVISACCLLSDPIAQRLSPERQTLAQKQEQNAQAEAVAAVLCHPERFFPSAWMTAPSPAASVLATVPQMLKTPLAANGWTLEEVSSDNGTLTATWKAARASSLLLPPEGAERLAQDATRARSVTETPAPKACTRQWQELVTKDEVQAVLSELAARFGLKMQLSWKPVRTIKKDNAVVSCPWTAGSLVLSQAPGTLFFDFPSLTECLKEQRLAQSLVLSGITWNKKQWIMQGEVYAKP